MKTNINIRKQGAVLVNEADIEILHEDICTISIDLKSKYCEVESYSNSNTEQNIPEVFIGVTQRSITLNSEVDESIPTIIELIEFEGWEIYLIDCLRYTIHICLIKK